MQKLRKITVIALIIMILSTWFYNCYASSVAVTKENLNTSLQKFVNSEQNDDGYTITVGDNIITVKNGEKSCNLSYDLTDKPTFSQEVQIQKGMSYESFELKTDSLYLPMIGYLAVADIQGVDLGKAETYVLKNYLLASFSSPNENPYTIVKQLDDGVTVDTSDNTVILASEFGERVMEYVNTAYKNKQVIKDEGTDSFEWVIERKDVTETSCKLVSTLSVNLNADFSKLNSVSDLSDMYKEITKDNAEYFATLKVGQKAKIEIEKVVGYELQGDACECERTENSVEFTAKKVGKIKGYVYVGDVDNKKSFYIIVESNTNNESLDDVVLKAQQPTNPSGAEDNKQPAPEQQKPQTSPEEKPETKPEAKPQPQPEQQKVETKQPEQSKKTDTTVSKVNLPATGASRIFIGLIIISISSMILFGIKLKNYKDIK